MVNNLRRRFALLCIVLLMGLLLLPGQLTAQNTDCHTTSNIQRVSVSSSGEQGNDYSDGGLSISYNGQFLIMVSYASNLTEGDSPYGEDTYMYNRETCEMIQITKGNSGYSTSMSYDATIVTFFIGTNIYAKNLSTGFMELVSILPNGNHANLINSYQQIAGDGRYVWFVDNAIYVRDLLNGETQQVLRENHDRIPSISANGRFVAFKGHTNPQTSPNVDNVYLYDMSNQRTTVIASGFTGSKFYGARTAISGNGRYVAFASSASNIAPGAADTCTGNNFTGPCTDTFMYDAQTKQIVVLTPNTDQVFYNVLSTSHDGRFTVSIAFYEADGSYLPEHIEVADTLTHRRMNLTNMYGDSNLGSVSDARISGDGHYIVFVSNSDELVPDDTNNASDVFVAVNPLWEPVEVPARNYYTSLPIQLTWAGVTGATQYQVQVDADRNFTAPILINSMTQTTSFDVTTLENGTYYWRVRADKGTNEWGSWSAVDSFVVDVP